MVDCRTPPADRTRSRGPSGPARAFTLIEILVVIAVIAILVSLLLPALTHARESGRSAVCLSNERQMFLACRAYADENRGVGPAIGEPYTTLPNWALVVQATVRPDAVEAGEFYYSRSVLVCPTVDSQYPAALDKDRLLRTYAMNATGHAGLPAAPPRPADPDNFDQFGRGAYINFDRVLRPSDAPLFVDSKRGAVAPPAPPPTRTLSPIDFRQSDMVDARLGRFHARGTFNAGMLDGSARARRDVPEAWLDPLP